MKCNIVQQCGRERGVDLDSGTVSVRSQVGLTRVRGESRQTTWWRNVAACPLSVQPRLWGRRLLMGPVVSKEPSEDRPLKWGQTAEWQCHWTPGCTTGLLLCPSAPTSRTHPSSSDIQPYIQAWRWTPQGDWVGGGGRRLMVCLSF